MPINVDVQRIFENIRINSQRDLFWLHRHEDKKEPALIVGSGPSLAKDLDKIREFKKHGAVIVAINGAAAFLKTNGIEVDWLFMLDARPSNIKFVNPLMADRVLMASQCEPMLFDAIDDPRRIVLFHSYLPGFEKYLPRKVKYHAFHGGITSGLTALCAVPAMGYRTVHLFGYDSSDDNGIQRPFEQYENESEQDRIEVICAKQKFSCSFAMYKQAEQFPVWQDVLFNDGVSVTVHGDGLLPTIARENARTPEPDAAIYDLDAAPASWDFLPWLANAVMNAKERGAKRLRVSFSPGRNCGFREDNLPLSFEERAGMLDNVMRPALELFGAVEDPTIENGYTNDYMLAPVSDMARHGLKVPMITPPKWAREEIRRYLGGQDPIVITLREASYWENRNSNIDAWLDFAERRMDEGETVIILRDTERAMERLRGFITLPRASLDLKIRAALYERAKANLFVANGPIALAYFGSKPFLIFKPLVDGYGPATAQWWSDKIGVEVGQQYPWARDDQRIVWSDDTLTNIETAWAGLMPLLAKRSFAA